MPDFRVLIMRCVSVDAVPVLAAILLLIVPLDVFAQEAFPMVSVTENADGETEYSLTLQVLLLMTVLTLLPSFLIMMTSFVRIIIVLSLLRQAIGTAQTPPNQVLIGIALFLSIFIMSPVLQIIYDDALTPYINDEIAAEEALETASDPLRDFMLAQTREEDVGVFLDIADMELEGDYSTVPMSVLIPAFMTSELKTAFTIGFLLYIPFVIIDLVVASVLMSMGMMMLSPMMISMPFKLMLFVLADGWMLVMQSITASFTG
ncbi:MAG: flagellar type III secretion system pore protein FliP [Pseudohongiellaceae bacterium]